MSQKNLNILKNLEENYGNLSKLELEKLSSFLSKNFKNQIRIQLNRKVSTSYLNWLYNKNPNGKAITYNIYNHNQDIIAHFALVPIFVIYKKKKYKSALTVFTGVDKRYRSLQIFHKIGTKTIKLAKDRGFKFIIGVANDISAELFDKCFKFKSICKLDFKIGLKSIEDYDLSHDFKVYFNDEILGWRLRNPRFKYRIFSCDDKFKIFNDIYKVFNIEMGSFYKQDALSLMGKLNQLNLKLNPLNIWIGLNNNHKKNIFSFNLPKILKPSGFNFIIKDLTADETYIEKKDIKFNLIDYDVY